MLANEAGKILSREIIEDNGIKVDIGEFYVACVFQDMDTHEVHIIRSGGKISEKWSILREMMYLCSCSNYTFMALNLMLNTIRGLDVTTISGDEDVIDFYKHHGNSEAGDDE